MDIKGRNNILIRHLATNGYVTTFVSDSWKIWRRAMIVTSGKKTSTIYITLDESRVLVVLDSKVSTQ